LVTHTSKHDITKEKHKPYMLKFDNKNELIMTEEDSNNNIINVDVIEYWHTKISN
jgi:hypothetical protein